MCKLPRDSTLLVHAHSRKNYTLHVPLLREVPASSTRGLTAAFMPNTVKQDVSRPCGILSFKKKDFLKQSKWCFTDWEREREGRAMFCFERGFEVPGGKSLSPMTQCLEG